MAEGEYAVVLNVMQTLQCNCGLAEINMLFVLLICERWGGGGCWCGSAVPLQKPLCSSSREYSQLLPYMTHKGALFSVAGALCSLLIHVYDWLPAGLLKPVIQHFTTNQFNTPVWMAYAARLEMGKGHNTYLAGGILAAPGCEKVGTLLSRDTLLVVALRAVFENVARDVSKSMLLTQEQKAPVHRGHVLTCKLFNTTTLQYIGFWGTPLTAGVAQGQEDRHILLFRCFSIFSREQGPSSSFCVSTRGTTS